MTKKRLLAEIIVIAIMAVLCVFSAFSTEADSAADTNETASTAIINAEPVSNDKIDIVIVKEEDRFPFNGRIAIGLGLICGAAAVCYMCVRTLRKENIR